MLVFKITFFLLFITTFSYATALFTTEEQAYIKNYPTITYSETNWEPLSIIENDAMHGIMGDYLTLIAQKSGLEFKYVPSNIWPDVLEKFKNNKIDMIPGVGEVDKVRAPGILSKSYAGYHMVIVTTDLYRFVDGLDDLSNKTIAVPKFFTSYNYMKKYYPHIKLITTKSISEALFLVQTGKADAFVGHTATALHYISKLNLSDLKISGTADFIYEHHILLHKDKQILLSIINKSIGIITNKERSTIYSRWVKVKVEQKITFMLLGEIVIFVILVLVIMYRRHIVLKKYNRELKTLTDRMKLSLKAIKGGVWDMNLQDNSVYFDDNVKELLGHKSDGFANAFEEWQKRVHPQDIKQALEAFENAIKNKEPFLENEHRLQHKDGHWIWVSDMAKLVFASDGTPLRMIGLISDITQRKEGQEEILRQKGILKHQAHHDSLTSLPNRVLFMDRLQKSIQRAQRSSQSLILLFIDLDEFKQINDSLGHETGDKVLIKVAQRLKSIMREEDTLARLGGDEFTVIMENVHNSSSGATLSLKILESLATPIIVDSKKLYISSSIGISVYPQDDTSAQNLLKYADTAMYKAKAEGRNTYQFYSGEMTEKALQRVFIESSLRQAIEHEEFVVFYQPQIDTKTDTLSGVEALIRWQHPTRGMISPDDFIPLAEEKGLIVEIDRIVMKTAMQQVLKWHEDGFSLGVLSLNLSLKQLNSKDFLSFLRETMTKIGFKAQWLGLEILEGQLMKNPEKSIASLRKIHDLGIELAIDDFGTGYSSLSYLKKLPLDKLKIDKSFVDGLPHDEEDVGISRAVLALAKSLNLKVIAEGVETQAQKEFLQEEGCTFIQGYYYSKPLSSEDMTTYLRAHQ